MLWVTFFGKKNEMKMINICAVFVLRNTPHSLHFVISPVGLEFPWGPKPFAEVIAGPLLRNNRQTTDSSSLEGHYVGVYFSAHWVSTEGRGFLRFLRWPLCVALEGKRTSSAKWSRKTVETDKIEEEEGGGQAIVRVCLH